MSRAFMIKQAPFKPTDIGGCQLWLDANDSTTLSLTGSVVNTWRDKSSNGYTGTSSGSPTLVANSQNGLPCISFSAASSQYFNFGNILPQTAFAVFIVMKTTFVPGTNQAFIGKSSFSGESSRWTFIYDGSILYSIIQNGGGPTASATPYSGVFTLFTLMSALTDNSLYANGTSIGTNTPYTTYTINNDYVLIGAYQNPSGTVPPQAGYFYNGIMGEIIYYNTSITPQQRQQVEAYLAQKWGLRQQLPPGHPGTTAIVYPSQPIPTAIYWRYPSTFVPTSIGNCQLWLDASDTTKIGPSGGGTLTSWTDKSGTGKTVTIVNAPSYSTTGFNTSYPCVTFTSANSLTISITAPGTTDIAMFAVWTCTTSSTPNPPNNSDVLSIGGPASGNETAIGWNSLSTAYVLYTFNVGGSVSPTNIGLNIPLVESGIQLSGTQYVYVNGYDPASTGGSVYNQTNTTVYIGGGSAFRLQGQVAEVLYYNSTFTTSQRQQVEGYLAWKWGLQGSLPANHPYKNSSPSTTNPAGISRPANVLPIPPIVCTPVRIPLYTGTYTTSGKFTTFTGNGTVVILNTITVKYFAIGGGGGGGAGPGGGGGAGGLQMGSLSLSAGTYNVVIGQGGGPHATGSNTTFGTTLVIANGGGYGASGYPSTESGGNGGCGGGGSYGPSFVPGVGGIGSQGYNGGVGDNNSGAGGGGTAAIGGNSGGSSPYYSGAGGNGTLYNGSYYGGGGGGGTNIGGGVEYASSGGLGGGGKGGQASPYLDAVAGSPNTGGGGGGGPYPISNQNVPGAAGGSGVFIISY